MTPAIIMVAPNGARKTRRDHDSLPVSIADTVSEALLCFQAGASVLHGHVRGDSEEHVLDVGRYRELLAEMTLRVPQMLVQITTEAVGRYSPEEQVACVQALIPKMASVSLREITSDYQRNDYAADFFSWCLEAGVHIQHILYSSDDLQRFVELKDQGIIPASHRCMLFVLGRYREDFQSEPDDLAPFLAAELSGLDWFTCAFGSREQECVMTGINAGGHARVGFENNLYLPGGEVAANSAELVSSLARALQAAGRDLATAEEASQLLGIRSA